MSHSTLDPVRAGSADIFDIRSAALPTGRLDLYAGIHKALRLFMTRTLTTLGSADPSRHEEVTDALQLLTRLLDLCEVHLADENAYMHPALERASPGSADRIAAEHDHHGEAIADLRDLAAFVADSRPADRNGALQRLYRSVALFVADNLQHMHIEETAHNAVLWAAYTDAELQALEHALVAAISPAAMFEALHWFMPALNASERAGMPSGMQQGMPPEVFGSVLGIAQRTLSAGDHAQLLRTLVLPVAPEPTPAT